MKTRADGLYYVRADLQRIDPIEPIVPGERPSVSPVLLERLGKVLAASRDRGLLGPGDTQRHVQNALGFARAIPVDSKVMDLGSGGGVPGLVLLVYRPDLRIFLLDAARRRTDFLNHAIGVLGEADPGIPGRSSVLWGRAEDMGQEETYRGRFEVVVARSFGPPAVAAECARPFLGPGGRLIVSEPPVSDDGRWPAGPLESLKLRVVDHYRASSSGFVVLEAFGDCPEGLPRRAGVAQRRPAF